MNIFKKSILFLILVFTLITSSLNVNYVKAEDDDTLTNDSNGGIISVSDCNDDNSCLLLDETNNNLTFTLANEDKYTSDKPLIDGADVSINVSFNFTGLYTTMIAKLGQLVNISKPSDGDMLSGKGTDLGDYKVILDETNNDYYIYILYDKTAMETAYPGQSKYSGAFEMAAKAQLGDDAIGDDGKAALKIGDSTYNVYSKYVDSSLTLNKESKGDTLGSDNKLYRKFEVTASSIAGNNSEIVLTDTLTSNLLSFVNTDDYPITLKRSDNENPITLANSNFEINGTTLTVKIDSLPKDVVATLTYYVSFSLSDYGSIKDAKNGISASYKNNNKVSSNATGPKCSFTMETPSFSKNAEVVSTDEDGDSRNVKWTITITGKDFNEGFVLSDVEKLTYNNENVTSTRLTSKGQVTISKGNSFWTMSYDDFANGGVVLTDKESSSADGTYPKNNPLKVNLAKDETITISYTNTYDIQGIDIRKSLISNNKVNYTNEALGVSEATLGGEANYGIIPGRGVEITKDYIAYDSETKKITWRVTIIVPSEFTDFKFIDEPSSNISIDKYSLKIYTTNENEPTTSSFDGTNSISLSNGKDETAKSDDSNTYGVKKYILEYTTTLNRDSSPDKVENKFNYKYKYMNQEWTDGKGTSGNKDFSLIESKNLVSASDTSGIQTWKIRINLKTLDSDTTTNTNKKFIITDTLPRNMKLINDSFTLGDKKINVSLDKSYTDGKFVVDITNILLDYKKNISDSTKEVVDLTYQTKFINLKTAADDTQNNNYKYTNSVTASYNGENDTEEAKDVECKFSTDKVFNKTQSYNGDKTPNILTYTITINPSGIDILGNDKETFTITDKLGSALNYDSTTVKIINTSNNSDITSKCVISVDTDNNTMTIGGLPNKTPLKITYMCDINLAAGSKIDDSNKATTTNSISLDGVDGIKFGNDTSFDQEVQSAQNKTHPISATLTLTKVDSSDKTKKLSGATFKAYIVKYKDGEFVKANKEDILGYNGEQIATTNSDGVVTFSDLLLDELYCYEEVSPSDGYDTGDIKGYVIFDGDKQGTNKDYEHLDSNVKFNHIYNYIGKLGLTLTNSLAIKGRITITKTISGNTDISKEEAENNISFVLSSDDNVLNTYKLSDFEYDEDTKIWTLELKELELNKSYTIKEEVKDIKGYVLKNASYSVNTLYKQSTSVTNNFNSYTLDSLTWKGLKVDFTNEYVDEEYEITISKLDSDTSKLLEGATLELYKDDAKIATINDSKTTINLSKGTYILKETDAPKGYLKADPITFTVDKEGTVNIGGDEVKDKNIEVVDDHITKDITIIKKVNGVSYHSLTNLKFKITNKSNGIIKVVSMLDSFSYNKEDDVYQYTFKGNVYDTYLIEEVSNTLSGYKLTATNDQNEFKVGDENISIKFTNDYEKIYNRVVTCEEYMNSNNWTWSQETESCVYKVGRTNAR